MLAAVSHIIELAASGFTKLAGGLVVSGGLMGWIGGLSGLRSDARTRKFLRAQEDEARAKAAELKESLAGSQEHAEDEP